MWKSSLLLYKQKGVTQRLPLVENVAHAPHIPSSNSSMPSHHVGGEQKEQILSQKPEPCHVQIFCKSFNNKFCSSLYSSSYLQGPSSKCRSQVKGLSKKDRTKILGLHNYLRKRVAQGKAYGQPPAANMRKLVEFHLLLSAQQTCKSNVVMFIIVDSQSITQ